MLFETVMVKIFWTAMVKTRTASQENRTAAPPRAAIDIEAAARQDCAPKMAITMRKQMWSSE